MTWNQDIRGRIGPVIISGIISIICKGDRSYSINGLREILAPAEMNSGNIILRICISIKEEWLYIIKFFLVGDQKSFDVYRRLCIHYRDDAMKNGHSTFELQRFVQE
jgi:hypothetical protein